MHVKIPNSPRNKFTHEHTRQRRFKASITSLCSLHYMWLEDSCEDDELSQLLSFHGPANDKKKNFITLAIMHGFLSFNQTPSKVPFLSSSKERVLVAVRFKQTNSAIPNTHTLMDVNGARFRDQK